VPPQGYLDPAPHGAPLAQPHPPCGGFTALLAAPLLPDPDHAPDTSARQGEASQLACTMPGNSYSQYTAAGITTSAVQQSNGNLIGGPALENGDMHGKFVAFPAGSIQVLQGVQSGVQSGGMQLTAPEAVGARALAGLDPQLAVQSDSQRPLLTAANRAHQSVSIAVVRPLSSGSHSHSHSPAALPGRLVTAQISGGQAVRLSVSNTPPAVRRGFGGILNGVVKEAAETATKRPPVFRYEDFKPVQLNCYSLLERIWGACPLMLAEENYKGTVYKGTLSFDNDALFGLMALACCTLLGFSCYVHTLRLLAIQQVMTDEWLGYSWRCVDAAR